MEEITLSENLCSPKPWKSWIKEQWKFVISIFILSLISLGLLWHEAAPRKVSVLLPEPKKETMKIVKLTPNASVTHKKMDNPFSWAKHLYRTGDSRKAIVHLLTFSQKTNNDALKEKAEKMAKRFHRLSIQKQKYREQYLEAYILFQSYPEMACQKWKKILTSPSVEDPYVEKARRRHETLCH